ncbi:hypothetical protein M413DRAFT_14226 [Hebeloma cylindrosporum]|uniref:Uncharacterized protein n=1 Tax=Hebeloma cylindrosporum TaxID=76867 RepID=A0A0C3BVB5_HEBCY|nr:hypothetical protein M413DRAFT_14226 [Hebeloma cylindrosporum h7]
MPRSSLQEMITAFEWLKSDDFLEFGAYLVMLLKTTSSVVPEKASRMKKTPGTLGYKPVEGIYEQFPAPPGISQAERQIGIHQSNSMGRVGGNAPYMFRRIQGSPNCGNRTLLAIL